MFKLETARVVFLSKANRNLVVDETKFSDAVQQHIWEYGLRQMLNDAMASAKIEEGDKRDASLEAAAAMAEKRLANLYAGTLRAAGLREGDPVRREARKIAEGLVTAKVKAKGLKPADVENFAELVNQTMDNPQVKAQAEANVKAAAEISIDIDL